MTICFSLGSGAGFPLYQARSCTHSVCCTDRSPTVFSRLLAVQRSSRLYSPPRYMPARALCCRGPRELRSLAGPPLHSQGYPIQWISVSIPWSRRRARASLLIHRANCCPGPISKWADRRTAHYPSISRR